MSKKNTKNSDNQRPFLGLRSFEEKNKSQFGGRDEEIKELFGLIENRGLTVVFGKSGIGKTSLIKAGLLPELRQNFYFPIYIRIDYSSSKPPLRQLRERAYGQMKKKDSAIAEIGDTTLWEYFHNVNLVDGLLTPVLILDQFEETFTLGDAKMRDVLELVIELADLAENRIPLVFQEKYQNLGETVPPHYGKQGYRVVLSLREDFLARLEELKRYMPSILDNRFRVVQMTIEQALDAAVKPGKGLIDEAVASEIIKKLPGISQSDFDILKKNGSGKQKLKVEPFLLSLICDRINEKRIDKKLDTITFDLVSQFNIKDVIHSFYNETIKKYGRSVEHAIEDRLLTEGGFRKLQSLEGLQGIYNISDKVIDELVDERILRKEMRDGVEYVELIHDVLAPVIKEKRDKRVDKDREEKRKALIERAKAKNRAKINRIGTGIAFVLAGALIFAFYNLIKVNNIEKENDNMALARSLLFTAQSLGSYDAEHEKAALISRIAYRINENNKSGEAGEDMYDQFFYNSMYRALKNIPENQVLVNLRVDPKSVAYVGPKEIYIGKEDGTVRVRDSASFDLWHEFYDFKPKEKRIERDKQEKPAPRVTSLALFRKDDRNLLAMAGTPDSVVIYNLDSNEPFRKFQIPESKRSGKYVEFTSNGGLILNQRRSIVRWDNDYGEPSKWHKRTQQNWYNSVQNDSVAEVLWDQPMLTRGAELMYCFSVYKDSTMAIGIDGGIILLTDDKYLEQKFSKVGKITAVKFQESGNYLIMGNEKGEIFDMTLNGDAKYRINEHQFHTERITDIAYSPNDTLVATASADGTVVIMNRFDWKALPPLNSVMVGYKDLGDVNNVSFTEDGIYVSAVYNNGTILKWPIRISKLAELICEEVNDDVLTEEDWNKYIGLDHLGLKDFNCPGNN